MPRFVRLMTTVAAIGGLFGATTAAGAPGFVCSACEAAHSSPEHALRVGPHPPPAESPLTKANPEIGGPPRAARDGARPNILVIVTDDAGYADWGFRGSEEVPTPAVDSLAARGVYFDNAYAGAVCSPSRAMMVTGRYGSRIGYVSNIAMRSEPIASTTYPQGLPPSTVTIFERVQALDYHSLYVGKWHLGYHADETEGSTVVAVGNRPQRQGVDEFRGVLAAARNHFVGIVTGEAALRVTVTDAAGSVRDTVVERDHIGRFVTDVFGDWSVDFIREHHGDVDPFFLFVAFSSPHTPVQAIPSDLAYVDAFTGGTLSGPRRHYAAFHYAADRNIGKILSALEDPDGNGDTQDSITDQTLIVFLNDNGGDCCDEDPNYSSNFPLAGGKRTQWEGGVRVPMIIAGSGVDPSMEGTVFSRPVSVIDLVPTILAAAGGNFAPAEVIDGVDLVPYANGLITGEPHPALQIQRHTDQESAVRVGDYKLMYRAADGAFSLFDVVHDMGESDNLAAAMPDKVAALQHVMTDFDVQMDKPRWDLQADDTNQFDTFVFREDAFAADTWGQPGLWGQASGVDEVTMTWRDAYANAGLIFRSKDDDYSATNDLANVSGLAFLLNRIELVTGPELLTADHVGTIDGLAVKFCDRLSGAPPELALTADSSSQGDFTFDLALPVELYDDLTISGDGNQSFVMSGGITEYRPGRSITKTGSSAVTLTGPNNLTGTLDIQGGLIRGQGDQCLGLGQVTVGANAALALETDVGEIAALSLEDDAELAVTVRGPASFGGLRAADVTLGGTLVIHAYAATGLAAGDRLPIIAYSGVRTGEFDEIAGRCIAGGLHFRVQYGNEDVALVVTANHGDYDFNGKIDLFDATSFQRCYAGRKLDVCCKLGDIDGDDFLTGLDWTTIAEEMNLP